MKKGFTKKNFDLMAKIGLLTAVLMFFVSLLFDRSLGKSLAKLVMGIIIAGIFYGIAGEIN